MLFSEEVLDTVAELLELHTQPREIGGLCCLDDYIIALCLDTGLPEEYLRKRLQQRLNNSRFEVVGSTK